MSVSNAILLTRFLPPYVPLGAESYDAALISHEVKAE